MKKRNITVVLLMTSLGFWHCSPRDRVWHSGKMGRNGGAALSTLPAEYELGFGDVLDIKFFRNTEFNETVTVRPDGRISLARVDELYVAGMTPAELDSVITATYAKIIRQPDVTVIVRDFGGYQVYVLGEVNRPGGVPIQRKMTVLQALAAAGGPKISAKMGSVMILRRGERNGVDAIKVDLKKAVNARRRFDVVQYDIRVEPQDIIYVPKTLIANVSDFMRQVYAGILPPLDLYLRAVIIYDDL